MFLNELLNIINLNCTVIQIRGREDNGVSYAGITPIRSEGIISASASAVLNPPVRTAMPQHPLACTLQAAANVRTSRRISKIELPLVLTAFPARAPRGPLKRPVRCKARQIAPPVGKEDDLRCRTGIFAPQGSLFKVFGCRNNLFAPRGSYSAKQFGKSRIRV